MKDNKLTRMDIARRLKNEVGSLSEAANFTGVFFEVLSEAIAENDKLKIHNFGVFRCNLKKARLGRNPKTGQAAAISARRVVNFMASEKFKGMVSGDGSGG